MTEPAPAPPAPPPGPSGPPAGPPAVPLGRLLVPLIAAEVALHAAMSGQRMAAPLQVLQAGHGAWAAGVLLALFAALPVVAALASGRLVDRLGFHRPFRIAVVLVAAGAGLAALASLQATAAWAGPLAAPADALWRLVLLCVAASVSGLGANLGWIAVLRSAGRLGRDGTERLRIFSWTGIAPSLANAVGPVTAGFVIDGAGYPAAYAALVLLALASVGLARRVPADEPAAPGAGPALGGGGGARSSWTLLATPGFGRLLVVNWLLSTSWDVHSFAVPVLGHERGYSASTVGLVLGTFTVAVTAVRFLIPVLAHRLQEVTVLRGAMVGTALLFALYPLAATPWVMGTCAALLGLTLGVVQPMVMSTLHRLTPEHRHGEAIALRSMAINLSSSVMPLSFGLLGAAIGAGALFWLMGVVVAAGIMLLGPLKALASGHGPH